MADEVSHLITPQIGIIYTRKNGDTLRFWGYDNVGDPVFMPINCEEDYILNDVVASHIWGAPEGSITFNITILVEFQEQ